MVNLHRHGPFVIHHFQTIGSTNDYLKEMIDAPEFTCVVADEQTAGRGRRTRVWHSTAGCGLYLSVLLRPRGGVSKVTLLSLVAAVAAAETLIQLGVSGVDIKWPNDLLINERKACGILIESAGSSGAAKTGGPDSLRMIMGVGVNLNHRSFPDEISRTATSIAIEMGKPIEIEEFRDRLLDKLFDWYERWQRGEGSSIIDRWRELSSYACGRRVVVTLDHEQITGQTAGLNADGGLLVMTDGGELKTVLAGEVSHLRDARS